MARVKIRSEPGVTLEQLEMQLDDKPAQQGTINLESLKRLDLVTLKSLQKCGPQMAYRLQTIMRVNGVKVGEKSVSSRLSALCGKGLVTVVGTDERQDKLGRKRTVYVYDISEMGWSLLEKQGL